MRKWLSNMVGFTSRSTFARLGMGYTQNMYAETRNENDSGVEKVLLPFGGYSLVDVVQGTYRGSFVVKNCYDGEERFYGVWGDGVYILVSGELLLVGNIGTVSGRCSFCETAGYGSAHPRLLIADGNSLYCIDVSVCPVEQRTSFRSIYLPYRVGSETDRIRPTHCSYCYGHVVVNDDGSDAFWTSCFQPFVPDSETGSVDYDIFMCSESPSENNERPYYKTGYITYSEWKGDITKAIIGNGSSLFTFGTSSVQVFCYNSTVLSKDYLAGDVWTCPSSGSCNVGIVAENTLAQFGDTCVFLGKAELGGIEVFTIGNDAKPKVISTPDIERCIGSYNSDYAYGFCFMVSQHPFYAISFPIDKVTLVYDFREEGWVNMSSSEKEFRYKYPAFVGRELLFGCDGALVRYTESKWNEHDGTPIVRKRCGGLVSSKGSDIFVSELNLVTNNGDYSLVSDGVAHVSFRYSVDGKTFCSSEVEILGTDGDYGYDTKFYDIGCTRSLSIEVSCSDNIPFCIMGMDADIEECIY